MSKKVAVIMGSDSDLPVVKGALEELDKFGIPYEVHVMSAHRTPALAAEFASNAKKNGFGVILSAAGKAAHLGGVLAAHTTLPGCRHPGKVVHIGRTGCTAGNRSDAEGNPGGNSCHRWRSKRSDPGCTDAGTV